MGCGTGFQSFPNYELRITWRHFRPGSWLYRRGFVITGLVRWLRLGTAILIALVGLQFLFGIRFLAVIERGGCKAVGKVCPLCSKAGIGSRSSWTPGPGHGLGFASVRARVHDAANGSLNGQLQPGGGGHARIRTGDTACIVGTNPMGPCACCSFAGQMVQACNWHRT